MSGYYLGKLPDDQWRTLLEYFLNTADSYRVHVPDGDGPLSEGRAEFRSLPGASVTPWSGMKDAIEISGELSDQAKELFTTIARLWDYRLLRNGEEVLSVGDFHDLLVYPTEEDLAELRLCGLNSDDWDPLAR